MRRRPVKSGVKYDGSTVKLPLKLPGLSPGEEGGIPGVAVKCVNIWRNTSGEGGLLARNRRSGTKAWGANGIRYPGSPCRKRWVLGVGGFYPFSAAANALSTPPGEYDRKVETQRN